MCHAIRRVEWSESCAAACECVPDLFDLGRHFASSLADAEGWSSDLMRRGKEEGG